MSGFDHWMRSKFEIGIFLVQRPEMDKPSRLPQSYPHQKGGTREG